MLTLPPSVRIFVATEATDLRKSFDGLSAIVESVFGHDPLSGHVFVFWNRRGNQVRCLFWDRTGYAIFAKRLARGTFRFAHACAEDETHVQVEAAELSLILEGIDLSGARRHKRYRVPRKAA